MHTLTKYTASSFLSLQSDAKIHSASDPATAHHTLIYLEGKGETSMKTEEQLYSHIESMVKPRQSVVGSSGMHSTAQLA